MTTLLVGLLILSILGLAIVSGGETALFSLSSMQIQAFKKDQDSKKRLVSHLLGSPRDLLVTLIILVVIFSLFVQNIVSTLFATEDSWVLNVGVPLGLNLVLGEAIPKSLAMPNKVKVSKAVAPLFFHTQKILYPVRVLISEIVGFITPIVFFFLQKEKEISVQELQHALKTSKDQGILLPEETELVQGYLHLQESSVKELMRPREEVLFFDIAEPLSKLLHLLVDQECTRVPVCNGGIDQMIGIVSSRLFFLHRSNIQQSADLIQVIKKPYFVPEVTKAAILLKQFYEKKESLAVVVDEYGSISGIISLEDLVEEVIGDVVDRRHHPSLYTRASKDEVIASGKLELSEFEDLFGFALESSNNMVTIGGWLIEQMGDIPKPGTRFETKEFLFQILAADPNRIRRVYIRKITGLKKKGPKK